jgi:sarcosine oxidase
MPRTVHHARGERGVRGVGQQAECGGGGVRVAVIGAGVVGLATSAALLEAGAEVSCFEAVRAMSQRSTGSSRIFRLAHGTQRLVSLAVEARVGYARWSELAGRPLVGAQSTVVAGPVVPSWAAAMRAAGAEVRTPESGTAGAGPPVSVRDGPVLVDPAGGVIDAAAVGEFLVSVVGRGLVPRAVRRIGVDGTGVRVFSGRSSGGSSGGEYFDACVLAAGAATPALAAQVGLVVAARPAHHARFTFRLCDSSVRPPCLLDKSETWRPGFTSYQHLTAPGRWAVGAHQAGLDESVGEVAEQAAIDRAREFTTAYVREMLPDVDPEPLEQLYCDSHPDWGDGFVVQRAGAVLEVHGDNLFKLAPTIGHRLALAALDGSTPTSALA